jgi:hypothetical protein
MPQYSFLVRETLKRNRIYKIDATNEAEARDLLDGFKQEPVEQEASQENIIIEDYEIRECYRSKPEVNDPVFYKSQVGKLSILRGNWLVLTDSHAVLVKANQLEWDEACEQWDVLEEIKS